MTASEVAYQAVKENRKYEPFFSAEIIKKLRLATIAQWLYIQDESMLSHAARTAEQAITILNTLEVGI